MLAHEKTAYEKAADITPVKGEKNQINLLEQKVMQIKLNGYETSKPFGKAARDAEVNIFSSFIDSLLLNRVKDVALHSFHPKRLEVHSFPGIAYSVIRDIFPHQDDFLIVDAGGEATEISLIKNGGLFETLSFPMGHNHVLRKISRNLEVSHEIALSSLALFLDGKTFVKTGGKIETAVNEVQKEWNEVFQSALGNLSEQKGIPSFVYIIAEIPFFNLFRNAIEMKGENQKNFVIKDIVPVEQKTLALHYERNGIGEADTFLSLEAIFLNKIFSKE